MSLDGWLRVDLIALAACENPALQDGDLERPIEAFWRPQKGEP